MTRPIRDRWLDESNSPRVSQVAKRPKHNVIHIKDGRGKPMKPIKTCPFCYLAHQKGWPDCDA